MESGQSGSEQEVSRETLVTNVYAEIYRNIRATDDYSFKLLGYLPLVSGGGIFALLAKSKAGSWPAWTISALAFLGAMVTLGLFCWELRNIQTCEWLRDCAKRIEGKFDLPSRPEAKRLLGVSLRKTTGEVVVYVATIVAWLMLAITTALRGPL